MAGWGGELWKSSGCKFQTTSLRPGDCQIGAPFNFRLSPNWSRYVKSSSDTNLGAWRAQSVTLHPSYTFLLPQMYKIERVFVDTRKRKRRTSLEGAVRAALESYFIKCPKPNTQAIKHISDDLGLERDVSISYFSHHKSLVLHILLTNTLFCSWQVVRVWFCNRRQKGKRLALPLDEELEGQLYEQSPSPIPSQAYPGPSFTGGPPPTLYMPQLPRPDVMKQALNPGVVGHPTR